MAIAIILILLILIGIIWVSTANRHKVHSYELIHKGLFSASVRVTYVPNWLGRQFQEKEEQVVYNSDTEYWIDSMKKWYIKDTGVIIGRIAHLDDFLRRYRHEQTNKI